MQPTDIARDAEFADADFQFGLDELWRIDASLRETLGELVAIAGRGARARCARLRLEDQFGARFTVDWSDGESAGLAAAFDALDLAALRPLSGARAMCQTVGHGSGSAGDPQVVRMPITPPGAPVRGEIGLVPRSEAAAATARNPRLASAATIARNTLAAHLRHLADTRHLAALYLATPMLGYLLDASGAIVAVTEMWLRHFGYRREDVIGRNARHFMSEAAQRDFTKVRDELWRNGGCRDYPCQFVTRDGAVVDVLLSASVEFDRAGMPVNVKCALNDVSELLRAQRSLEESRRLDGLTGALNGEGFIDVIERELSRARRHVRDHAVMLFEIAHFDAFFARHGAAACGHMLAGIVEDLRGGLRAGDEVARLGGGRFGVLLADIREDADTATIGSVAGRLLARVQASLGVRSAALTLHAGVTTTADGRGAEVLMARAGVALGRAREANVPLIHWRPGGSVVVPTGQVRVDAVVAEASETGRPVLRPTPGPVGRESTGGGAGRDGALMSDEASFADWDPAGATVALMGDGHREILLI